MVKYENVKKTDRVLKQIQTYKLWLAENSPLFFDSQILHMHTRTFTTAVVHIQSVSDIARAREAPEDVGAVLGTQTVAIVTDAFVLVCWGWASLVSKTLPPRK